jgi:hypothetical protein
VLEKQHRTIDSLRTAAEESALRCKRLEQDLKDKQQKQAEDEEVCMAALSV